MFPMLLDVLSTSGLQPSTTTEGSPVPNDEITAFFQSGPCTTPSSRAVQPVTPSRSLRRRRPPLTLPGEQRVRPSKSNPIYGLVDGAKRGSERWEVPRKVPKLTILPTWADCNKKFNEKLQSVIRLAEEAADETGCWIYLAAQMPTGRNEYTHFASQRLRKEAPGPVNDMNAIAHKMFHGLVNSRRKDVLHAELEVATTRTDMRKLNEQNAELTRAKDDAEAVIQGLRARIAASGTVSSSELQAILDRSVSTMYSS
ncbi:hypothetical protein VNI00_019455 [Paramarasmius palmivorus]|uniref:Uncharacterized protein n=1 Tax=Paramarasmius palmivorus TaxID=297713 RepID=A0AAW0AKB5_9AGAR